ncbi:MAG: hypothetical protein ETSY1_14550 [Candidatus Entotheonella factor]|uniref:Plasmid stabilization protein n=1 Tax=Entotheonella factor TaxID=1429438 RepID=W4LN77_ENTF1|nr:MAG: hypothetical protein ETSY1_14550 [Candidatus Entotheonella factor]
MPSRLNKLPQVQEDLIDCALRIAEDNLEAAERFLDAAEESFERLASMPWIGQACEFSSSRAQGLRRWQIRGFENYLIFYRPENDGVTIVRIIHGSRDIEAIFNSDP